jgi:hypothetical protein
MEATRNILLAVSLKTNSLNRPNPGEGYWKPGQVAGYFTKNLAGW